ncbi:LPS export ABC transporter permease LptG [Dyella solisilvae]|uniref:LPS export ABC transporter permease LptG n=2 Tax=Dyella solisilvae TaxID=1920168 RepID=A0A370K5A6_9GAMM|nr:LPS export ABC transporter permease LptG [Dyella solisilvae]
MNPTTRLWIKRVDLLVGLTVLGWVLIAWFILVGLDSVLQFLRQLRFVGQNGFTVSNAAYYVSVTIPRRMYEMYGSAALIGSLLGLGGLASTGELTALRAAGLSPLRIAISATWVVTVLMVGVVIIGETIGPWGDQQDRAMQLRLRTGAIGLGQSGLWARDGDRIINAARTVLRGIDGHARVQLLDVKVFTMTTDGELSRFDHADTAEHVGNLWILGQVRSSFIDKDGVHSTLRANDRWQSQLDPNVLEKSMIQPQYLSTRDQLRNIRYLERNHENPVAYTTPFWGRILYPLNTLVLMLSAIPFAFGALRSGGAGRRVFMGMLLALIWHFGQQVIVNFGVVYGAPPLLANLLPAILTILLALLYFRQLT